LELRNNLISSGGGSCSSPSSPPVSVLGETPNTFDCWYEINIHPKRNKMITENYKESKTNYNYVKNNYIYDQISTSDFSTAAAAQSYCGKIKAPEHNLLKNYSRMILWTARKLV